jgi:hypothetical protein
MLFANVRQEPKANTNVAYKICDLAYKILKVQDKEHMDNLKT